MRRESPFGVLLKTLLEENSGGIPALSEALNYSGTTMVYRWLRGERTPGLTSGAINVIAIHLKLTDEQKAALKQAQYQSLELAQDAGAQRKSLPAEKLTHIKKLLKGEPTISYQRPTPGEPGLDAMIEGLGQPRLDEDNNVFARIIALLNDAPPPLSHSGDTSGEVILTWQGRDTFDAPDARHPALSQALAGALSKGWRVRHLCRLNRDIARSARLVEMMIELIGAGAYQPCRFTSYGFLTPPYDVLVIPGYAAAILMATRGNNAVDAGIVTHDPAAIAVVEAHARLLASNAESLITPFSGKRGDHTYYAALANAESHLGGRLVFKHGLSIVTEPKAWLEERADPHPETASDDDDATRAARLARLARITSFEELVQNYEYRDICTIPAIERLVNDGVYPSDEIPYKAPSQAEFRLQHLRNVVRMLRANDRYQLGLLNEEPPPAFWEITGDNSVFLETWSTDPDGKSLKLTVQVKEPLVADGFREHFDQLWNRITPDMQEKNGVVTYLERQIKAIEARISAARKWGRESRAT